MVGSGQVWCGKVRVGSSRQSHGWRELLGRMYHPGQFAGMTETFVAPRSVGVLGFLCEEPLMSTGNSLPLKTIQQMQEAWLEKQSISHVSRRTGVSRRTVRRYVTDGDPRRGVEPFSVLTPIAAHQMQRTTETELVYTSEEARRAAQRHVRRLDRLIDLAADRVEADLARPKRNGQARSSVRLTDVAKCVQIRAQIVQIYKPWGEIERTTTTSTSVDIFRDKSPDELGYYAEHGTWPDEIELAAYESDRRASLPESHLPPVDPRDEIWPKED